MTKTQIIHQLETLIEDAESHRNSDGTLDDVFQNDAEALRYAITEAKRGLVREFCHQYRGCDACPLNVSRNLHHCGGYEWADENGLDMVIAEIRALGDGGKADD